MTEIVWTTAVYTTKIDSETSSPKENSTAELFTSSSFSEDYIAPYWAVIFDRVQLFFTCFGFVTNILTMITLAKNHRGFSKLILILLRHQSLVDCWVCAMATAVLLQPFHWLTGVYHLDIFICHAWHGQAFYWGAVTLSTYNLVLISAERYMAVCRPFDYNRICDMSKKRFCLSFFAMYVLTLFVTHGTYIQTKLIDGDCINEYAFSGDVIEKYFFIFVIFTYLATYLLPALTMIITYGLVIRALSKRGKNNELGRSQVIDRASAQLTKTAIAVTAIFIISIGYDLHYYLLGYTGVVKYQLNTPLQKTGVFLSNLNSFANPLVYGLLMPLYRRSLAQTFCCPDRKRDEQEVSGSELDTGNTTLSASNLSFSPQPVKVEIQSANTKL